MFRCRSHVAKGYDQMQMIKRMNQRLQSTTEPFTPARVLEAMLGTAVVGTKATKGALAFIQEGEVIIGALAGEQSVQAFPGSPKSITDMDDLCLPAIQQTVSHAEPIIFTGPALGSLCGSGGNESANQPEAILCLPMIQQGAVTGVLYLENPHADSFDERRLAELELLTTGATVSFRNSQLMEKLNRDVVLKTAELQRANEKLRKANRSLLDEFYERQLAQRALRESEARYRYLFENMSSGVAVYEPVDDGQDFVFVGYNNAAERLSHYERKKVIGRSVSELFPPVEEFGITDVFRRVWQSGEPEYFPMTEWREGSFIGWIENYVYKLPSGEIVAIFDDVTARKVAEDQLKQQKELLESTIEALDHPFYVIRAQDFVVEIANSAARELSADETLTTCYALSHRLDQPCSGPDHRCPLHEVVFSKEPVILEHTHYRANGETYPVEVRGYPLFDADGNVERLIEYTLDITERKRAERAAKEAATRAERERLARDLHDAVSQNLFSAGLITELLPELWELDQYEARRSLDKLRQLLRATSAEMRTMLLELRPDSLIEADLDFLLEHLAESLTSRTGIPVALKLDADSQLSQEVKIALYRVVQEAFNNIAKHAEAQEVQLSSAFADGRLEIIIEDDGRGFDPGKIPPGHLGVGIMHERIAQIGGTMRLTSAPGMGTHIVLQRRDPGALYG